MPKNKIMILVLPPGRKESNNANGTDFKCCSKRNSETGDLGRTEMGIKATTLL